ncbi:hypothetical protein LJR084_005312 [Variovorax sp. LjRoot84]|uniref:hypothetical protein n=1 Tax=unclassified Variovorax TaxID=663243 RepID=UPI003ECD9185
MTPSKENANAGSVWIRFWSPTSALEPTPAHASAPERAAIRSRNYVWLKTYMDIYILRWGALWAACLVLALLATDDAVPGVLFAIALASTMASFFGLVSMVLIYRRAVRAVKDRTA